MTIVAADRLVRADGADSAPGPGWLEIAQGRIVALGDGAPARPADRHAAVLTPGFIDLHTHGGGGYDVTASAQDLFAAVGFHRRHGTTATLVSLVTAPVDDLCAQLARVALLAEDPANGVLGAHLEGPFLSRRRCGAQNPAHLIDPDPGVWRALLSAAAGALRVITVAPELPGALPLIDAACAAGVTVAIGHTDADHATATAAFERGATLTTHLCNGMRPIHHREPGPIVAALERGVACELIYDGLHLHPAMVRLTDRLARAVFVTDAIAAAGIGDGDYTLGGLTVAVRDGVARLADNGLEGSIAGSMLTMDAAVRRAVRDGMPLHRAVAAATANPAAVLGVEADLGTLAVGRRANVVLLDDELHIEAVVMDGVVVDGVVVDGVVVDGVVVDGRLDDAEGAAFSE